MVRKSERNKSKSSSSAVPEKTTSERGRKSCRQSRRRRKSSSESDVETDGHIDKDTKEVGEISESKAQSEKQDSGPEVKNDGVKLRQSARRQPPPAPQPEKDKEQQCEKNSEWKEDPGFWGPEDSAPPVDESGAGVEGTTWKIQSSNGSGGEIQKLKICRQRVTDSSDSSSPAHAKDTLSPRRKRNKSKNTEESTESGGDTPSNQNETIEEIKTDSATESSVTSPFQLTSTTCDSLGQSEVKEAPVNEKNDDNSILQCDKPPEAIDSEEKVVEEKVIEPSDKDKSPKEGKRSRKSSESNEAPENKLRRLSVESCGGGGAPENPTGNPTTEAKDKSHTENLPDKSVEDSDKLEPTDESAEKTRNAEEELPSESSKVQSEENTEVPPSDENVPDVIPQKPSSDNIEEPTETSPLIDEKEDETAVEKLTFNTEIEEDKSEDIKKIETRVRTQSETSEDGRGERKTICLSKVKVQVNSEVAMEEIAKKLNERAARFSKDSNDNCKEKKRESVDSIEPPKSPREEGELTPTPEQMRKSKHTTIVINKPKEFTSQPTRLKRNTDELPPIERKRRILLKSKSKDKEEDPINISSQSLMLLVPEVKTITPEQVAAFPLDDEDLTKLDVALPPSVSETKPLKKKIDLKPKEVEIRVENDTRQVIKKRQIIIGNKDSYTDSKAVGPRLPSQENHRVLRKISLVNEDVKKPRRSPSPGGKSPMEVLYITNLVRPFTVPQLRELLARTGTIATNGFYIDKIKSKCFVKYTDVEMAVETRHALNGVRWPVNNPKTLKVEFASPEEMAIVQKLAEDEFPPKKSSDTSEQSAGAGWLSEQAALKPQRRVTTAVREWDMGKIGAGELEEKKREEWHGGLKQQEVMEQKRRPISPVENKFEAPPRKIKKRDNDAPARLLDDLFRKTKATPCIYWLPLTAAQIAVKEEMRRQHVAEHERRLAELRKSDHGRRDKDREKSRDRRKK